MGVNILTLNKYMIIVINSMVSSAIWDCNSMSEWLLIARGEA